MLLFLSALVIVIILVYYVYNVHKHAQYFKERRVAYQPLSTAMKRLLDVTFGKMNFLDLVQNIYKDFPNERIVGVWQFGAPTIYIRDPTLIKQLTIKDFDYFTDHRVFVPSDELLNKNIFSMKGQKWRDMRATLSPAFTSSKMRNMYVFMDECAKNFVQTFADKREDLIQVEMKDILTKYASDVIASASFGIKCDSLGDPENDFHRMGKSLTEMSKPQVVKMIFIPIFPKITEYFNLSIFPKEVYAFFKNVIRDTMKTREENNIIRPDMIHLLMEARKGRLRHETVKDSDAGFATVEESSIGKTLPSGKLPELTDDEISAQALIFFFAGFESVASTMSYMAFELGKNPDVQEKLHEEIDEVLANAEGGNVTYEDILKMKYLDQVLSETLRKWAPGFETDRVCVRDYVITPEKPGGKPSVLKKGDVILIPIVGLHHDPKYYANPDTFNPDRFSDENRKTIVPGTYIPFGMGPRSCVGSRFALLEIKVLFFHLLAKFELVFTEKTVLPLQLITVGFSVIPRGGFPLGLKRRKEVY